MHAVSHSVRVAALCVDRVQGGKPRPLAVTAIHTHTHILLPPNAQDIGLPMGTVVHAAVVSMTDREATLDNGHVIGFDYAALCHGSSYSDTFAKSATAKTRSERLAELAVSSMQPPAGLRHTNE